MKGLGNNGSWMSVAIIDPRDGHMICDSYGWRWKDAVKAGVKVLKKIVELWS